MKHTPQRIRKLLHQYLIRKNNLKSQKPKTEPEYFDLAYNCAFSVINYQLLSGELVHLLTVIWGSTWHYDVLYLEKNEVKRIARDGCCSEHCNTWDDMEIQEIKGELLPISQWKGK